MSRLIRLATALLTPALLTSVSDTPVVGAEPALPKHADLTWYPDADGNAKPVQNLVDWEKRRAEVYRQMQIVMGPVPRPKKTVPLDVKVESEEVVDGITRKKLTYHTDSTDRRIKAWLYLPAEAISETKPLSAMLCLHQTTGIGKNEPAGIGGRPNLHYALHLAKRGYVTLSPDYPSFGEYPYQFPKEDGYISGTMKAIYDNMRSIDVLQSLKEVDGDRIGCIGHSLGGHNTMFTAAFDKRIKVMVSNCGFTRFHKYYSGRLKGWTSTRYMPLINDRYENDPDKVPFDFPEIVASFAPRPFLASSPIGDGNFEVSGVRDSIKAALPIYRLYGAEKNLQANYPDCSHDFPEDVRKVAYEFLDRHLK